MLGKLIKYDFKSTYREFVGIFMAILLGVTILPLILSNVNNQIVSMITGFIAFGIIIAIVVVVVSSLFQLFNTNVFSSQGYLALTLPVTSRDIVLSKLIISSMWIILTGIVSIFALFLLGIMVHGSSFSELTDLLHDVIQLSVQNAASILLVLFIIVTSCVKEMAKLFLSCSISPLKQFNRFRIPAGILSYFALSWLETLILQMGLSIARLLFSDTSMLMQKLQAFTETGSFEHSSELFNAMLGAGTLYALLLSALFSISTILLLDHKLDLE